MNVADRFLEAAANIVKRLIELEEEREEFILAISSPSAVDPSRDYTQGGAAHDMADDVARLEETTRRIKALKRELILMQGYVKQVDSSQHRYLLYTHGIYSDKVDESLRDIITYCAIALAMRGGKDE